MRGYHGVRGFLIQKKEVKKNDLFKELAHDSDGELSQTFSGNLSDVNN